MLKKLGKLNALPAAIIDRAYRDVPRGWLGRLINFIKIRSVYAFLFYPATLLDLIMNSLISGRYLLGVMFLSDDGQEKSLSQLQHHASLFSKNLYALLAFPFGFFNPKLVAFYFTPETGYPTGVGAGGNYYQAKNARLKKIISIEELKTTITQAAKEGKKIIARGAGRSQGKQFIPENDEDNIVLDLSALNTVEIHASEKIAIVGAGAIWADIQKVANQHQLALKVMQASNVFSVGGSIGTNIHGWDHHTGMLSNTIIEMNIVNAKGELQTLTPRDALFHHVTGGLGLFGVVVSVKLQLTDNILLKEIGQEVPLEDYPSYFQDKVLTDAETKMHLYRLSLDPKQLLQSGVAVSYVETKDKRPTITPNLKMEEPSGSRFNRVMINLARRLKLIRKTYWQMEKRRILANKSPAVTVNEIMQPPINAMFNPAVSESEWLQEYFLPEQNLVQFLRDLGQLLMKNNVVLLNASVRYVKQNADSPLSYAKTGDRYAVVLCFNQSLEAEALVKAQKWLRQSQKMAITQGGAYYLPYQHVSAPEDFANAYPGAGAAMTMKAEIDPETRFDSGLYRKYLAPKPAVVNHFKHMMSTEENRREFAGFLKNILHRIDVEKFFSLIQDILTYKDSHEEIYAELCRRLAEIRPNMVQDLRRILESLSRIKHDLGQQARTLLPPDLQEINGLVEIGYPGRFVNEFKKQFKIKGEIVAVYEQVGLSDYVQTGFPRPYERFEHLNYQHPRLTNLAANSADLITCYVGLHHFEEAELRQFLQDIRRVLRPNGHFLLVDHDVIDETTMTMAHMAHSVFNAVNEVSLAEEMQETRHFHPMAHWQALLAEYNLAVAGQTNSKENIREGDPSRNQMICVSKAAALTHTHLVSALPRQAFETRHRVESPTQSLFASADLSAQQESAPSRAFRP